MALWCHVLSLPGYWVKPCGKLVLREAPVAIESQSAPVCGSCLGCQLKEIFVANFLRQLWSDERGQDIAEYAVMLAVILVIVIGTVRLIGTNANTVFSQVSSTIQ